MVGQRPETNSVPSVGCSEPGGGGGGGGGPALCRLPWLHYTEL